MIATDVANVRTRPVETCDAPTRWIVAATWRACVIHRWYA